MTSSICTCGHDNVRHNNPITTPDRHLVWGCVAWVNGRQCPCMKFVMDGNDTRMTRQCPICGSQFRELLYSHETTMRGHQEVYSCLPCGMTYSSVGIPVDYSESVYSEPQAVGSGDSPEDMDRLDKSAEVISRFVTDKESLILDCGCAQGGMLSALSRAGFESLYGIDLSHSCCDATIRRGFKAVPVGLSHVGGKFDCIIFSHVLEHVEDPALLLREALQKLNRDGIIYIEVPNAAEYITYANKAPFLDFNSEHINHFDLQSMIRLLNDNGFELVDFNDKNLALSGGMDYPAMWIIARRKQQTRQVMEFVSESKSAMDMANHRLFEAFDKLGSMECILWGAGEYLGKVIDMPVFRVVKVRYIVDRNKSLHGKTVRGIPIQPYTPTDLPIVIASSANSKIIRQYIRSLGATNEIIELEFS